ncbi:enoyl-CoA hydratase/isomerase family protein [bacterium]|nr:enoyl-CoA hydratase/isomerase family protein [bacterium]
MSVEFNLYKSSNGSEIGVATLNNPKNLNSVSLEMIKSLNSKLLEWQEDTSIATVIIDAEGEKAFCAGGDIVRLYEGIKDRDGYPEIFFENEYRLDYLIHTFKKPVVIWGDGIVMGGGMGIMQGGDLRIATERTMMAMPEVTIGLYPDVGASYFLKNCPGKTGFYLALTGARVNGSEAVWLDFADHFIKSSFKADFYQAMQKLNYANDFEKDKGLLVELAQTFSERSSDARLENNLKREQDFIDEIASCLSPQEFEAKSKSFEALSPWAARGIKTFSKGSPTSVGIIFEQFQRAKKLSLKEAFQMEWIISVQCCRHPDFKEGVRALLIDKDNQAKWTPSYIGDLQSEWIAGHFVLPEGFDLNPLEDL